MSYFASTGAIEVLKRAADLTTVHGPDPAGCIRAAVFGVRDAHMPFWDTAESLLVEEAVEAFEWHTNPGCSDADERDTADEWASGRSATEVRDTLRSCAANTKGRDW